MRKTITHKEAEILLEKYYEGCTSVNEEKKLVSFLSQSNLPSQFEADKAILGYFESQKSRKTVQFTPLFRLISVAASIAIVIISVYWLTPSKPDSFAYINGEKVTDMEQIKEQALATINIWKGSDNSSNTDTEELINQQLQLFSNDSQLYR